MMHPTQYYIINPNYRLFNDVKRAVLVTSHDKARDERLEYSPSFQSFIHPVQARMLSFFDGKSNLQDTLESLAAYFGLDISEVAKIVEQYIENPEIFPVSFGDQTTFFPKKLLIPKEQAKRYNTYSPDDFPIATEIDLQSIRFNIPRYFLFVLSMECYTDCAYCYADRKHPMGPKLSSERVIELIDEIEAMGGAINIDCNGGDLPMRAENLPIMRHLISKGYHLLISTKYPLSESQVQALKETGLKEIQISLDSSDPQVLKKLLNIRKDDYYEKMLETFSHLDKAGIAISVHPVVTSLNCSLEAIDKLLQDVLAFEKVHTVHFTPATYSLFRGNAAYTAMKPDLGDLKKIHEFLQQRRESYPDKTIFIAEPTFVRENYEHPEAREKLYAKRVYCSGNQKTMVIMPDGNVTVCEEMYWHPRLSLGNVSTQSIMEVWHSEKALKLYNFSQKDISEKSACKTCGQFDECRGNGKAICWKFIQYFYGRENWDYPYPSCKLAPAPYNDCLI